ncbi:MAG: alpha/beta fold hydrolase [Candidatus Uhrbacteria bacterium]|nr:alpha/beta fold hydrolase [Candidatus Uhrbacteria bacterium]
MHKRVFMIHGWDGTPEHGWFPWLKLELEKQGFEVIAPQMPEANAPRIYNWVPALSNVVGEADENTYFVGHSMGCQTIVRYLETLPKSIQVGGAVFVAGFLSRLTNLEDEEEVRGIAKHWLERPLDIEKVKSHLPKSIAIFSDNDEYVPLENQDRFRDELGSQIIIEHAMGHFSGDGGTTELPSALKAVLELTQ